MWYNELQCTYNKKKHSSAHLTPFKNAESVADKTSEPTCTIEKEIATIATTICKQQLSDSCIFTGLCSRARAGAGHERTGQ